MRGNINASFVPLPSLRDTFPRSGGRRKPESVCGFLARLRQKPSPAMRGRVARKRREGVPFSLCRVAARFSPQRGAAKALLILPLCVLLLLTLASAAEPPDGASLLSETQAEGTCGDGMTWRLDADGIFTVSGYGAMDDYATANTTPWRKSARYIEKVNIEYGVARVGNNAFSGCQNLVALTVPETVRAIGDSAFANCVSLNDIVVANGLREIGNYGFSGCSAMQSFPMPQTVTDLGQSAFSKCTSLSAIDLSETSLLETRTYLFSGCASLRTVTLPDTLRTIQQRTFANCAALSGFEFPRRVSTVAPYAFQNCASLQSLDLPALLTDIDSGVFSGCAALERVGIPESVRNIKENAFQNCNALRHVYYGGTATQWNGVSKVDFADMIERRFIKVHYGQSEAASDVVIEGIDVKDGRVTVSVTGNPKEGSSLLIASYGADGRFLALDTYPINDPNAYTVFSRDAHTLTAFLLDSNRRPAAVALRKEVA